MREELFMGDNILIEIISKCLSLEKRAEIVYRDLSNAVTVKELKQF
jgi:hypothetical protein